MQASLLFKLLRRYVMTKQEIRKLYLQKRRNLSPQEHRQLSELICEKVFDFIDSTHFKALHCYLPIAKFCEIDTTILLRKIDTKTEVKVYIPKVYEQTMSHHLWTSQIALVTNKWGILEPNAPEAPSALPQHLLVIVPLLSFDITGHRVGYGKGFYDRFLADLGHETLKIGISFFEPVETIKDTTPLDQKLDICFTPNRCYDFRKANF